MLGCFPSYNDYGHPERVLARRYWTVEDPIQHRVIYGYTRAEVCRVWLRRYKQRV